MAYIVMADIVMACIVMAIVMGPLTMQEVVRTSLAGCTILVIAHRLRSIIDADQVCLVPSRWP